MTRYYVGFNGQKFYLTRSKYGGGPGLPLAKARARCEKLNRSLQELELAVPDILPGAAEVGVSVAGRDPDFNDMKESIKFLKAVHRARAADDRV